VDVEQFLGLGVEGFEIRVGDRPRRRDAALLLDDAEILRPHAEHGRPVDLGLAADEVGLLRVQVFAVLVVPGLVAILQEDGGGRPVELLLRQEGTALEDENALAGLGQPQRERTAAGAGSDDDRVVGIGHASMMRLRG
jgi:hypothetical protein